MIFNQEVNMDFGKFYLTEFFKNSLSSGESTLNEQNYLMLDELCGYLVQEDNVINGFEKLAQYQGTNEFSIFLFDMIDHLPDQVPDEAYNRIPELANDFVNLYGLMLEEQECEDAINNTVQN